MVLHKYLINISSDIKLIPDSRNLLFLVGGKKALLPFFVAAGSRIKVLKECLGCFGFFFF